MAEKEKQKNEIVVEYTDNIEELFNDFMESVKNVSELCKNTPAKIKKNNTTKSSVSVEIKDLNEEKTLCAVIDDTVTWTEWSIKLTEEIINVPIEFAKFIANVLGESTEFVIDIAQDGIDKLIKWINDKLEKLINSVNEKIKEKQIKRKNKRASKEESKSLKNLKKIIRFVKKSIKFVKMIILKAKKLILDAQLWVYKTLKRVLESVANGKMVAGLDKAFKAILIALKACAAVIDVSLQVIQRLLQTLLASFLAIEAGCMAFALSPKVILTGKLSFSMKPIEPNNDLFSFGALEPINKLVDTYISGIEEFNSANSIAHITDKMSQYLTTGEIRSGKVNLKKIDNKEIRNIIKSAFIGILLNLSEPLPKYEKLMITNIRFLLWLTLVFEPGMKQSFGIPGMP